MNPCASKLWFLMKMVRSTLLTRRPRRLHRPSPRPRKTSLTLMLMPLMPSTKNFKRRCAKFRESFRTKHKITREQPKRISDSNSTPFLFDYKQCAGISFVVHPHTPNHKVRFKNIVISTTVLPASGHNSASKNPRRRRVLRTHPRRFSSGRSKFYFLFTMYNNIIFYDFFIRPNYMKI